MPATSPCRATRRCCRSSNKPRRAPSGAPPYGKNAPAAVVCGGSVAFGAVRTPFPEEARRPADLRYSMAKVETIVCFSSTWFGLLTVMPNSPAGLSSSVSR